MKAVQDKPKMGRPATGQMPKRYFRMDDEDFQRIEAAAASNDETTSGYIRRVLLRDANRSSKKTAN